LQQTDPTGHDESARLLRRLVARSKRTSGIQLPVGFVRTDNPDVASPLAAMLRGGRGGEVRLKLYLCITLLASKPPYDIRSVPARSWASALALPQPDTLGARRISDAITSLSERKMITAIRRQGAAPTVTLLSPLGKGAKYARPTMPYIGVPLGLWSNQWITVLSGSALALLIVLLDLQGGRKSPNNSPFATAAQHQQYSLSDATWSRGSQELQKDDLLSIRKKTTSRDFDWRRVRNTYWIDKARLDQSPFEY
jgi:hypothetical protein